MVQNLLDCNINKKNSDQVMNTYSLWQKRRAEKNRKNPALYRLLTIPSKKKKKKGGGEGYQKKIQMNKENTLSRRKKKQENFFHVMLISSLWSWMWCTLKLK